MHSDALEIAAEKESIVSVFSGCQEKSKMIKQITGKAMLNN
jgi:lipocalin